MPQAIEPIMHTPTLSVRDLTFVIDDHFILNQVSFDLHPGELMAVVGPSGSGKSSLLNVIAGFLQPTQGEIYLRGTNVSSPQRLVPPEQRKIGMVFQSHALWPQLSVLDNVAYPLRRQGKTKKEAQTIARETLSAIGMGAFTNRFPEQLSGGQQQRVGLARALAANPCLYLFDEPTANLDPVNRQAFIDEVSRRQKSAGIAGIYVTHHIQEAFEIADRVMVFMGGSIAQIGRPVDIYQRPASVQVAALSGKYNTIHAIVESHSPETDTYQVHIAEHSLRLTVNSPHQLVVGERVNLLIRPEWSTIGEGLPTTVERVRYQGSVTEYELHSQLGQLYTRQLRPPEYSVGQFLFWRPTQATVVD